MKNDEEEMMDFKKTYQPRMTFFSKTARENGMGSLFFYSNVWRREMPRYLAGFNFTGPFNILLVTPDGKMRMGVSSVSDYVKAKEELPWLEEVILEDPTLGKVVKAWEKLGLTGNLGVSGMDLIPVALLKQMKRVFGGVTMVSLTEMENRIRLTKSQEELKRIRKAAALADKAYQTFLDSVADGRNAYEIMADVERTVKRGGAEDNFMIVGVGNTEVMAMAPPTDRVPVKGDLIRTEITPFVDGYCAQICRSCVKGKPTKAQIKGFDIFLRSEEKAIKIMKAGVPVAEVAKAQNDVFRAHGLGDYVTVQYTRTRGHALGLWQSEPPIINEESKAVLKENQVMIVHPNTYIPDVGYLVLGDAMIVTKDGVEILTQADRELKSV